MPTLNRLVRPELNTGRANYAPILRGDDLDWLLLALQEINFLDQGEQVRANRIIEVLHRTHPVTGVPDPVLRFVGHTRVRQPVDPAWDAGDATTAPFVEDYAVAELHAPADDPFLIVPLGEPVQPLFTLPPVGETVQEIPLTLERATAVWLVRYLHQTVAQTGIDAHHRLKIVRAMERGVQEQSFPYKRVAYGTKIECVCGCGQTVELTSQNVLLMAGENQDWTTVFLPPRYRLCESDVWQAEWDAENADIEEGADEEPPL